MPSEDPTLVAIGALGGAAVAIGGAALVGVGMAIGQQGLPGLQAQQQGARGASMTTHNVIRDDQGRIQTVEAVEGLPLSDQRPSTGLAPPAPDVAGGL